MRQQVFDINGRLLNGVGEVWRYGCLHIPSGQQDEQEAIFQNHAAFLGCLAKWNAAAPGLWQYWPVHRAPQQQER